MPSRPLSWERPALVGLHATPLKMLAERRPEPEIVAELIAVASEYPKRTKREIAQRGRGTPAIRTDLISIVLGDTLRGLREHLEKHGRDWYQHGERARLLRLAGERAGGIDEALLKACHTAHGTQVRTRLSLIGEPVRAGLTPSGRSAK